MCDRLGVGGKLNGQFGPHNWLVWAHNNETRNLATANSQTTQTKRCNESENGVYVSAGSGDCDDCALRYAKQRARIV